MMIIVEALRSMGLTNHEAQLYISLAEQGAQTGYELANATGVPRANVYAALASMVDKGAVNKISEDPARYVATPPDELTAGAIRTLVSSAQLIVDNIKPQPLEPDMVVSLEGEEVILNKLNYLLEAATSTIYIHAASQDLNTVKLSLAAAAKRGVKVVIISLGSCPVQAQLVYENQQPATWIGGKGRPVRLITDSHWLLTGETGRGRLSRGVYSSNVSLVTMAKHAFVQEIILAEIMASMGEEMISRFGDEFKLIQDKVAHPDQK
ncbi:MAG: TrmB family transcriptional regulator [Methanomassiliicoccales archaeon]